MNRCLAIAELLERTASIEGCALTTRHILHCAACREHYAPLLPLFRAVERVLEMQPKP